MQTEFLTKKIELLERELASLKSEAKKPKHPVSLKGILKGVKITEEDIAEAKRSLFPYTK